MRADWTLWAVAGMVIGIVYACIVARLNESYFYGPKRRYVLAVEAGIAIILIAVEVCGLSGLWWLMRWIALAYISLGGPIMVALLITGVATGASEEEYGEIERIVGNNQGPVRNAGLPGGQTAPDFRKN